MTILTLQKFHLLKCHISMLDKQYSRKKRKIMRITELVIISNKQLKFKLLPEWYNKIQCFKQSTIDSTIWGIMSLSQFVHFLSFLTSFCSSIIFEVKYSFQQRAQNSCPHSRPSNNCWKIYTDFLISCDNFILLRNFSYQTVLLV